jgi:hypothetical protein
MKKRIKVFKKVATVLIINVFLLPTLFGGVMAVNNPDNEDDKVYCLISYIDTDIESIKKMLSEQEVLDLEKQCDILSTIYKILKDPKRGCLEKIWARLIGKRTCELLKAKNILPQGFRHKDFFSSLFFHREKRWGILTSIISYGSGKVYIPLKIGDRGSMRPLFRPIFWHYPQKGFTSVRFGATYSWPGTTTWGYRGWMAGPQSGVMMGFTGIHIKLSHKLRPDNHLLMGRTLSIKGNQYQIKLCS